LRNRLDLELVKRGLARSRESAQSLIESGVVLLKGIPASKSSTQVNPDDSILIAKEKNDFVSRGGQKLFGALRAFPEIEIAGISALDAGASTGGFTDVLLRDGAAKVYAVDVGYGQLAWELQKDDRVVVIDRTNIKDLQLSEIGTPVDLVVADLSFISLRSVLKSLIPLAKPLANFLLMVKPQFEVGKENIGSGGVVRDPMLRFEAVKSVADTAFALGLGVKGVVASSLPGPSGNVEYFLWLKAGAPALDNQLLLNAIAKGPE
jgi:23S rRNA (cytidine1920-2'-O)/16S rRNA (cytidine1409-2'-O)-methyltransferase